MIKIIILMTLIASSFIHASLIPQEKIDPNKAAVQVASFKKMVSVKKFAKNYHRYDTYSKKIGEWHAVYIVNIPMQNRYNTLKRLKKRDKNIFFIDVKKKLLQNTNQNTIKNIKPKTMYIKDFQFEGNSAIKLQEIENLAKEYKSKELSFEELTKLTENITQYYKEKGYMLAKAFIPKQNMQNGILKIEIVEPTYGEFRVDNNSSVDTTVLENFLNNSENKELSNSSLEKRLDSLKVLSGVEVKNVQMAPSTKPKSVDFIVSTQDTDKYNSYLSLDNYGSRYTGEYNAGLGTTINNLSGIGDSLSLNTSLSDSAKSKSLSGSYYRHIGYEGITGGANFSFSKYALDNIPSYESVGDSSSIGLFLNYPLKSNAFYSQALSTEYTFKKVKSDSGVTGFTQLSDKELNRLEVSWSDQRLLKGSLPSSLTTDIALTAGNVKLISDLAKTNDANIKTKGGFAKLNVDLNYGVKLDDRLTLELKLSAQKALGKNLDSSEDFTASGSNGVRAYEGSELTGDDGYLSSMELYYTLPNIKVISHNTSLFIEHARVWKNVHTFNNEDNTRTINAIGIGYNMSYQDISLKASFAHAFGGESTPVSEAEFSTSKNKFLVQALYRF